MPDCGAQCTSSTLAQVAICGNLQYQLRDGMCALLVYSSIAVNLLRSVSKLGKLWSNAVIVKSKVLVIVVITLNSFILSTAKCCWQSAAGKIAIPNDVF